MKKSHYLASILSLLSTSLFAQIGGIEDSVNDVGDTIRTIFPILLGVGVQCFPLCGADTDSPQSTAFPNGKGISANH